MFSLDLAGIIIEYLLDFSLLFLPILIALVLLDQLLNYE